MQEKRRRSGAIARIAALSAAVVLPLAATAQPAEAKPKAQLPTSVEATINANYPMPSGAIVVSPKGSDANPGTVAQPLRTVHAALKKVKPGGTVVLRGGVYREGASGYAVGGTKYVVKLSKVTIQNYPNERAWMDGTVAVSGWKRTAGTNQYSVAWSTPSLCAGAYYSRHYSKQANNGPCSYSDSIGGQASNGNPLMLFRNGVQLKEVNNLGEVNADTFYYDWQAKRLHIGFDPAGKAVEATKHAQALALFKPTDVTIRGIGFRRYATNQYGNATQGALLLNSGSNVILERVAITENAGGGLLSWGTVKLTIRSSMLTKNGANGMGMPGAIKERRSQPSLRDDLLVEYSRFDQNNTDSYGIACTYSCSAAGMKLVGVVGSTLRYNSFNNNGGKAGSGVWYDLSAKDAKLYGNQVVGNARHGIVYEASDKAVIASNKVERNGWSANTRGDGYGLMIGSANVRIYNNILINNKRGAFLYDDPRTAKAGGGYDRARVGPDSVNMEFVNNVMVASNKSSGLLVKVMGGDTSVPGNTTAERAVKLMASNSYTKPSSAVFVYWQQSTKARPKLYSGIPEFRAAVGHQRGESESEMTIHDGAGAQVKAAGTTTAGRALPPDIAQLLGVAGGSTPRRGVITVI